MTTKTKLFFARIIYYLLRAVGFRKIQCVQRKGIWYRLDLSEGIDLSVFLFGGFQKHIIETAKLFDLGNGIIMDVGANIGAMSFTFAKEFPNNKVWSIEASDRAFRSLQYNIHLNGKWTPLHRIFSVFVNNSNEFTFKTDEVICSSWSLTKKLKRHKHHGGVLERCSGIASCSIDTITKVADPLYVDTTVSLIKIDTDGSELDVLLGATKTIEKYKPVIIFEVGGYLLKERGISFADFVTFFESRCYVMYDCKTKRQISPSNYDRIIPKNRTTDIVACHVDNIPNGL